MCTVAGRQSKLPSSACTRPLPSFPLPFCNCRLELGNAHATAARLASTALETIATELELLADVAHRCLAPGIVPEPVLDIVTDRALFIPPPISPPTLAHFAHLFLFHSPLAPLSSLSPSPSAVSIPQAVQLYLSLSALATSCTALEEHIRNGGSGSALSADAGEGAGGGALWGHALP